MKRTPRHSLCIGAMLALIPVGCGEAATGPGIEEDEVVTLAITPVRGRLGMPSDSLRFAAWAVQANGDREPLDAVWASSNAGIAAIDARGWAVAVDEGAVTIEAVAGTLRGLATLVVNEDVTPPRLIDLFATPSVVDILKRDGLVVLHAEFADPAGVRSALAHFSGPFGASITGFIEMKRVESDPTSTDAVTLPDGHTVFEGTLQIPAIAGVGTWTLSSLRVEDRLRNVAVWGHEELVDEDLPVVVEAVVRGG